MTMHAEGKGPTGTKVAAWINKVLTGGLIKLIQAGRGIIVISRPNGGVTISTNTVVNQVFRLTQGKHQITSGFATGKCSVPGEEPAASAVDQDIYFTYAPGWYAEDQDIVCQNILGRWEVMSPAAASHLKGTLSAALTDGGNTDVVISGTYAGTVSAKNIYNLTGDNGNIVGVEWEPNLQQFVITAIQCPSNEE